MIEEARSVVVFLDTNALHYIHLYLTHADDRNLYPFSSKEDAIVEAREHLDGVQDANIRKALGQGLDIVDCLSNREVCVEYSRVSELELMAGRAKGRAVENAAKEGVPDRMWTRFHEKEIGARLTAADLTGIRKRVEGLGSALERAGILVTASKEARTRDVLDLAKGIAGLVYLGLADSVIYASSLVAGADYLITRDEYFRQTVNRIKNGQKPYDEIRQRLHALVGEITLDAPDNVSLPEAKRTL